jgi:AcrR family transcriptional regulator
MTEVAARRGFEAATIEGAARGSGFGKATFYKLFGSKEECLLEAFERCAETILARVAEASRYGAGLPGQVEAALRELLEILAAEPDVARLVLVEVRVAGAPCRKAQQRWLGRFAERLEEAGQQAGGERSQWTARMTVGALAFLLAWKVGHGETAELATMREELLRAVAPHFEAEARTETRGGGEPALATGLAQRAPIESGREPAAAKSPPLPAAVARNGRRGWEQGPIEWLAEVARAAAAAEEAA